MCCAAFSPICSLCHASWDPTANRKCTVWGLLSTSSDSLPPSFTRYRGHPSATYFNICQWSPFITAIIMCCTSFKFLCFTGLPPNPNKPAGYSVRMENTVPLVTQAPAIQPLQIRPGVITQVCILVSFDYINASAVLWSLWLQEISHLCSRPGLIGPSKSWYLPGNK